MVKQKKDNRIEILCHGLAIIHIYRGVQLKFLRRKYIMALPLESEERRYVVRFVLGGLFGGCTVVQYYGLRNRLLVEPQATGTRILRW